MKFNIATTLFVLVSMAVVCCVAIMHAFIQRDLVRLEVDNTVAYLENTVAGSRKQAHELKGKAARDLGAVCDSANSRCVAAVLSRGDDVTRFSLGDGDYPDLDGLVKRAAVAQQVKKEAGDTGRVIFVAVPFMSESVAGPQRSALGMAIQKPSVAGMLLKNYEPILVYLFVTVLLLTVIGFFRMVKLFVKPIERMVRLSEQYQIPEELPPFQLHAGGEFGQLSAALNAMIMRLEVDREKLRQAVKSLESANAELQNTQREMLRAEKLASIGRLSAGLAHEIGNPIGIVQGYVELLKQGDLDEAEREEFSRRAYGELERVSNLISRLLNFSRSLSQNVQTVNLGQVLQNVADVLKVQADRGRVRLSLDLDGHLLVQGDEESLTQVFFNCLLNSIDTIKEKGDGGNGLIDISARIVGGIEGGEREILMKIEDNGQGIGEGSIDAVFDPFFTTKEVGKGTGLGLFVSHAVIAAHGGRMWLESEENAGTRVFVAIPAASRKERETHEAVDR